MKRYQRMELERVLPENLEFGKFGIVPDFVNCK